MQLLQLWISIKKANLPMSLILQMTYFAVQDDY